jgi:hypothetical protein
MRGRTIDEVVDRRVQAAIPRVALQVHHPPALEQDIALLPIFSSRAALENESALGRANHDLYFLAHVHLAFWKWYRSISNLCSKLYHICPIIILSGLALWGVNVVLLNFGERENANFSEYCELREFYCFGCKAGTGLAPI